MIEINKQRSEIKITMNGDPSTLLNMRSSLLEFIKCRNFNDYPPQNGELFWAMSLLEELSLNEEQIEKAFLTEEELLTRLKIA